LINKTNIDSSHKTNDRSLIGIVLTASDSEFIELTIKWSLQTKRREMRE
jgi:hypothetical protein